MDIFLLVARLFLAMIFALAGFSKLSDLKRSRKAVSDFGLPVWLANPLGVLLPIVELITAVLLLPVAWSWWGGLSSFTLVLAFVAGITVNLALGRKPNCHCFGQIRSEPVGWSTMLRNVVLGALAGVIVWQGRKNPGLSLFSLVADFTTGQAVGLIFGLALIVALVAQGWLLFNLVRQNGRLLLRVEALEGRLNGGAATSVPAQLQVGLPIGYPAPSFELPLLSGKRGTLDALRAKGKPVLLIFSDSNCGPCNAMLPDLARWQREQGGNLTIALVSRGTEKDNQAKTVEHGLENVLLQKDREVAEQYECYGTPGAVLVQADGRIGSYLAMGSEAIALLVARTAGAAMPLPIGGGNNRHNHGHVPALQPSGPRIGEAAPSFKLPDLAGKSVELADFRGINTLLLFWNPGCGFCTKILDELKAWESRLPKTEVQLAIISTGTVEANRAQGFRSPVLLDQKFSVASSFGAGGTPSAVLVSADGGIVSGVAVGGPEVLALAGADQVLVIRAATLS